MLYIVDGKKLEFFENEQKCSEEMKEMIEKFNQGKADRIERAIVTWGYENIGDLSNGIPFHTITSLAKSLSKKNVLM